MPETLIHRSVITALLITLFVLPTFGLALAQGTEEPSKLLVVWTSGDREVALKMVFMYAENAKKNDWWKEVRLLVWGPSAKLLSEDKELQDYVKKMKDEGVEVIACKACADSYGVAEKLESIGVKVFYTGKALTEMLKTDWKTVSF